MARVADYVTIYDPLFRLQSGLPNESVELEFDMPAGFHRASRCVLMFTLQPRGGGIRFFIHLNDTATVWNGTFGNGQAFSMHEVIGANVLNQSNNVLQFQRDSTGPDGYADIGDVVLLCQVET